MKQLRGVFRFCALGLRASILESDVELCISIVKGGSIKFILIHMARIAFCGMLALCGTSSVLASEGGSGTSFSIRWENDTFGGTDANYTNGFSLALSQTGSGLTGGIWDLLGHLPGRRSAAYDLVQLQFTPDDIERANPDPNDRPYAGILYLGLTTFREHNDSLHGLKILFGVVGPASFGEELQRATHRAIGSKLPQGWDFQLKNEPIVNIDYEYRRRIPITRRDASFRLEMLPTAAVMLGNYLIRADIGTQIRFGYQLPNDYGATTLRDIGVSPFPVVEGASQVGGWYVYAGGKASLIGRDMTLDGNTFAESRNVDKRLFVPSAEFGASVWLRFFQTTFSYSMRGDEFYGQKVREDFGSILMTVFFR